MARVIWDGEKIVVDTTRLDMEAVNAVCEKHKGVKLPFSSFIEFTRNKEVIKDIGSLSNIVMDESFKKLYDIVIKAEESKKNVYEEKIKELNLPEKFYPFQKEDVVDMLNIAVNQKRNILLGEPQGTGKSGITSVFVSKYNKFPVLVVCPASLKLNWQVELEMWVPGIKTYIISGRDSYTSSYVITAAQKADVVIINYDILGEDDKEASRKEKERIAKAKEEGRRYRKAFIPVNGWVEVFNKDFNFAVIVCDEVQKIQSLQAIRSRAVIQIASDKRILKVFLSGTPFETKVKQFYNACHILAPDLFPSESKFLFTYCNPIKGYFGWSFDGVSNLEELHRKLSLFMIRHRKEVVLPQLPKKQNIPIFFEIDPKLRKAYDDMEEKLLSMKEGMHQFTYLAEMRKFLIDIKKDAIVQYVKDILDVEDKAVLFVQHTAMYEYMMDKFSDIAVGFNGGVVDFKRQDAVNKFQNDKKVRLFIGQNDAACTGITLTASHIMIFGEWGKTAAVIDQAVDRINRIGQTEHCLNYFLIVKDTIDEDPMGYLSQHLKDVYAVLDGVDVQLVDMDSYVIAKVKERVLMRKQKGIKIEYSEN